MIPPHVCNTSFEREIRAGSANGFFSQQSTPNDRLLAGIYGKFSNTTFSKMKNSGIFTALAMVLGIGVMAVSCEKEEITPVKGQKATTGFAKIGDDDEDPVIRGKVKKSNFTPVDSAHVETMVYGTNARLGSVYTNSLGEYTQKVTAGIYYLKVTNPNSGIPVYTDTMHVSSDREVNVIAD
jgi:hypothetical protein